MDSDQTLQMRLKSGASDVKDGRVEIKMENDVVKYDRSSMKLIHPFMTTYFGILGND